MKESYLRAQQVLSVLCWKRWIRNSVSPSSPVLGTAVLSVFKCFSHSQVLLGHHTPPFPSCLRKREKIISVNKGQCNIVQKPPTGPSNGLHQKLGKFRAKMYWILTMKLIKRGNNVYIRYIPFSLIYSKLTESFRKCFFKKKCWTCCRNFLTRPVLCGAC